MTTLSASSVGGYLIGRDTQLAPVQAQAALAGYHTAFGWSAAFFAAGLVVTGLLYRRGAPQQESPSTSVVHM